MNTTSAVELLPSTPLSVDYINPVDLDSIEFKRCICHEWFVKNHKILNQLNAFFLLHMKGKDIISSVSKNPISNAYQLFHNKAFYTITYAPALRDIEFETEYLLSFRTWEGYSYRVVLIQKDKRA